MSLVKFKKRPFGDLVSQDFFDMDDFFDNRSWVRNMLPDTFWNGKTTEPALNIKETDDKFEIELAAPGFAKKDFNITIDDGCLNISAEKTKSEEEKEDDYTRREFSYNAFERSLQLPKTVKEEAIKAKYNDGILKFDLVKKEEAKKKPPKVVEIA
ncbi:Hsp20/alpha crystallin family protein [Maribacter polysiphoniae]|uniref:HSP20 family protein n=1 Tax=Maribacter polysiphoniae TaxID=429344 RepID=A0A316DY92_9FLAO|nr:Hsp20/alpha crystallin family protein [Maribacter polysiphoniae]MBD1259777.1 Hsp20/alpha crystallin family protein [Maribacter polysiphoniae]PWK23081.1 HSP20 family protein [Maribacter polysiphoniae]